MNDKEKNLDSFLKRKLSASVRQSTSPDFTFLVMQKVKREKLLALEEKKENKAVKLVTGFITSMILGVIVLAGVIYKTTGQSSNGKYEPVIDKGTSFIDTALNFIQTTSLKIFSLFGLESFSKSLTMVSLIMILTVIYFLADRIFLKHRAK